MKITNDDYHVNDDDDVDGAEHVLYRLHETRNHRRKQFWMGQSASTPDRNQACT